jgi:hypothetical protein
MYIAYQTNKTRKKIAVNSKGASHNLLQFKCINFKEPRNRFTKTSRYLTAVKGKTLLCNCTETCYGLYCNVCVKVLHLVLGVLSGV